MRRSDRLVALPKHRRVTAATRFDAGFGRRFGLALQFAWVLGAE